MMAHTTVSLTWTYSWVNWFLKSMIRGPSVIRSNASTMSFS